MKNVKKVTLLSLMAAFSFNVQAYVTVGWTNDCDYDESIVAGQVQAAVDAGETEIRVTNNQTFTEPVDIGARSVIIKGGYNSCVDAENDVQSNALTLMSGESFTQSAFYINSSDAPSTVTIDGFDISNVSDIGVNNNRGSGIMVNNTVGSLYLKNLYVHNNPNTDNGGINIYTLPVTTGYNVFMTDVISAYNQAYDGGGLKCRSNGMTQININGQSGFSFNQSEGQGGGIFLNNCNLTFEVSEDSATNSDLIGINNNFSNNSIGGGIYVFGNSHVELKGQPHYPFKINNNQAQDGGGISVNTGGDGAVTLVELTNSQMKNNQAYYRYGGAVYAINEAQVIFKASDGCEWNDLCHLFDGNTADDDGGTFYLGGSLAGAVIEVNKAEITGSRSGWSGAVAGLRGDNSRLTINNSLIHKNGGTDHTEFFDSYGIVNLSDHGNISINYSTLADNDFQYSSIKPLISNGTEMFGSFTLVGSIIADNVSALSYAIAPKNYITTAVVNCVMFKEIFTNPDVFQVYDQVIEGEPIFIDAANGNYRLALSDTTAIDRCDAVNYPATLSTDVDGQTRPYDEFSVSNDQGTLDIGYDEVNLDLIIKHGFE